MPLVSIVIPCYNYGRYLSASLDSVLAQSFNDWECILVNNGSTDETKTICQKYLDKDPRFIYLESDNRGPAAARNIGLKNAKGQFIQFLDADDLLEYNKLNSHVKFLEQNEDVDLVYGEVRYFTDSNIAERRFSLWEPDREWMPKISAKGYRLIKSLVKYNIMTIHAPLFRQTCLNDSGFMDENLWGFEDWDLWLHFSLHDKKFVFYAEPHSFALVRSHSGSLNKDTSSMRKYLLVVWLKAMKSAHLPLLLWPYVLFRFEEEFMINFVQSLSNGSRKSKGNYGIGLTISFLCILFIPIFLPIILIVKGLRSIKKSKMGRGRALSSE